MLSPKELHRQYSLNPCISTLSSPYTHTDSREIFNQVGYNDYGAGTPANWLRLINFFKHVKYPCVYDAKDYSKIQNTGAGALAMTFRFLQELDGEAYLERQPTVRAGTSHSVRNGCDLARACKYINDGTKNYWTHRMATEYLEHFAYNSLPDCLMMCGPDLVDEIIAEYYRAPGYKVKQNEPTHYSGASTADPGGVKLNKAINQEAGMTCFTPTANGVAGAPHFCYSPPDFSLVGPPKYYCDSCSECPTDPITGQIIDPSHPCCNMGSIYYYNECCNDGRKSIPSRADFSYWVPSDDGSRDGTLLNGRVREILQHIGILERRDYGGYANFTNQCSGSNPPIIMKDWFLDYFQSINGWDYTLNTASSGSIERARTISLILSATANRQGNTTTNTSSMVSAVKDLLFNGYGVLLFTNVGFPSVRDSTGLVYPDRIFYQTYNIVGYDDTKMFYPEAVYVLHCPFGDWISGGHPEWGELPPGCFLITESILRCIINYYPAGDFFDCKAFPCRPPTYYLDDPIDCENLTQGEKITYAGCIDPKGTVYEGRCEPFYCTKVQKAFGFLIAVSLNNGFPAQNLPHSKYYPVSVIKKIISENNRRKA